MGASCDCGCVPTEQTTPIQADRQSTIEQQPPTINNAHTNRNEQLSHPNDDDVSKHDMQSAPQQQTPKPILNAKPKTTHSKLIFNDQYTIDTTKPPDITTLHQMINYMTMQRRRQQGNIYQLAVADDRPLETSLKRTLQSAEHKNEYICICGNRLVNVNAQSSIYGHDTANCDVCKQRVEESTSWWQCTKAHHLHRNGLDICNKCIKSYNPEILNQQRMRQIATKPRGNIQMVKPSDDPIQVETVRILNMDTHKSHISNPKDLISISSSPSSESYIISQHNQALIILIKFKTFVDIKSMEIHTMDDGIPKEVHIYKLKHLGIQMEDIPSLKSDKIFHFDIKTIDGVLLLDNISKETKKFGCIQFIMIHIVSNAHNTANTWLNGIKINGIALSVTNLPFKRSVRTKHRTIKKRPIVKKQPMIKLSKEEEEALKKDITNQYKNMQTKETNDEHQREYIKMRAQYQNIQIKRNDTYSIHAYDIIYDRSNPNDCKLKDCTCLYRIRSVLAKYQSVLRQKQHKNDSENKTDIDDENKDAFIKDIYDKDVLNDFHHLLEHHEHEFEDVYDSMMGANNHELCVLESCLMLRRNHRNRSLLNTTDGALRQMYFNDTACVITQQQLLDSIHCHYYHSFDIGYKIRRKEIQDIEQKSHQCNDTALQSVIDINMKKQQIYNKAIGKEKSQHEHNKFSSVIAHEEIRYSEGIRYFYWNYYNKTGAKMQLIDGMTQSRLMTRQDSNNGYSLKDWYIAAIFNDLKKEMLNNVIYCMSSTQWNILIQKSKYQMDSNHIKTREARHPQSKIFYGIMKGASMSLDHVAAMLIYCNQTELQREFTATYRRIPKNESDESLKKRHSNYAHLGRLLRECLDCFGENKNPSQFKRYMKLYHGITIHALFSSSIICLKGPVSTSTDYTVALHFCANQGLVIEVKLDARWCYNINSMSRGMGGMSMFDCHYISDYPNEQERFFIGGFADFTITNIVFAPSGTHYKLYMMTLNYLFGQITTRGVIDIVRDSTYDMDMIYAVMFRILSDQLHKHYPDNEKYKEFKSIPEYVKKLTEFQFANISALNFFNNRGIIGNTKIRMLVKSMFFYDYGWINLEVMMTVFPSLKTIQLTLQSTDDCALVEKEMLYLSICHYIANAEDNRLQMIQIQVVEKQVDAEKVKDICEQYKMKFNKLKYMLLFRKPLPSLPHINISIKSSIDDRKNLNLKALQKKATKRIQVTKE